MKYLVKIPITHDMGPNSIIATPSYLESVEENALWHYNSARAHDGLKPLDELPEGTTIKLIEEP